MLAKKYPLGIALSGGGAKAAAHCGAIKALEEYGLKPDVVAGTSAGALVATLYASGFSPEQMIDMFAGLKFFKDIVSPRMPKGGFFDSKPLVEFVRKNVPFDKIEELPIPTHIVASDIEHGTVKTFTRGELAPRVVASCSIPVIFRPMCINGIHYVDGGAFQNLPVPAIRQKCEKVIALNLNLLNEGEYKENIVSVAYRSFSMMFMSNTIADARSADLAIDLDTSGCTPFDLSKLEELFYRGYNSAVKALEENDYQRQTDYRAVTFCKKKTSKKKKSSAPIAETTPKKALKAPSQETKEE